MTKHTVEILPSRIIKKMVNTTIETYFYKVEHSFIIYGSRKHPNALRAGRVYVGEKHKVEFRMWIFANHFASFHTHPTEDILPSLRDIKEELLRHKMDKKGTYEAFAIGHPDYKEIGRIGVFMVTNWKLMEKVYNDAQNLLKEGFGKSSAYDYLYDALSDFTKLRIIKYIPGKITIM